MKTNPQITQSPLPVSPVQLSPVQVSVKLVVGYCFLQFTRLKLLSFFTTHSEFCLWRCYAYVLDCMHLWATGVAETPELNDY